MSCCSGKWNRDNPQAAGLISVVCLTLPLEGPGEPVQEYSLSVNANLPAEIITVTWYKLDGGDWVATGDTTSTIIITEEAQYMALVISSEGSVMIETSVPCVDGSGIGPWQTPDGEDWETIEGDAWIWGV